MLVQTRDVCREITEMLATGETMKIVREGVEIYFGDCERGNACVEPVFDYLRDYHGRTGKRFIHLPVAEFSTYFEVDGYELLKAVSALANVKLSCCFLEEPLVHLYRVECSDGQVTSVLVKLSGWLSRQFTVKHSR